MADRSGKGRLKAWQGLGRGQGPRSREGLGSDFGHFGPRGVKIWGSEVDFWSQGSKFEGPGSILVILGDFWAIFGPQPRIENFAQGSGTSQKGGSMPGDFCQDLNGRVILGSKI